MLFICNLHSLIYINLDQADHHRLSRDNTTARAGIHIYISDLSSTYQTCLLHIRLVFYISDLSECDRKQRELVWIHNIYYISDLSTTYQTCLLHIRLVYYISDLSTTYQTCLLHIRLVCYISDLSECDRKQRELPYI
jgi:hypothetical protein